MLRRKKVKPPQSFDAALEQLKGLSPEQAVELLDSGALDQEIEASNPPAPPRDGTESYATAQPFSYQTWEHRHNVAE